MTADGETNEDSAAYKADIYTAKFTDFKAQGEKSQWKDLGGPHSEGYEQFVHKLFTPSAMSGTPSSINKSMSHYDYLSGYGGTGEMDGISAGVQLKMARMEDSEAGLDRPKLYSPLEMMETHYNSCGITDKPYKQFQVYEPKSTSEYHSIMSRKDKNSDSPSISYKVSRNANSTDYYGEPLHDYSRYRLGGRYVPPVNDTYTMTEFRNPTIAPLSPYMHDRDYQRTRETRILGSDFVITGKREEDPFITKCNRLIEMSKRD